MQDPKNSHLRTIAQLCRAIYSQLRHISTIGKNFLNSNVSPTCPHNMVNFGPLVAEICWRVWGTFANFNGFCVLTALLHGTLVVCVSQTLRHWTKGATYIRQGGHYIGHWPTFLVVRFCFSLMCPKWPILCRMVHKNLNSVYQQCHCTGVDMKKHSKQWTPSV